MLINADIIFGNLLLSLAKYLYVALRMWGRSDSENIKQAILKVLENEKLKKELIKKGFENVRKFNWEKVAKETVQVYETATGR